MAAPVHPLPRRTLLVGAAFAAIYLIWGSTYLAIAWAVDTIPPFLMAGTRHLLPGIAMFTIAWVRGARPAAAHWLGAGLVGTLMLVGGNGGVSWAEQKVPSGATSLVIASIPLWITLMALSFRHENRLGAQTLLGLLLGFGGVGLLVAPSGQGVIDAFGALVLVGAAISWSLGTVLSRRVPLPDSSLLSTSMQMMVGGAVLLALGAGGGELGRLDLDAVTAKSLLSLAYLSLFGSVVAFTAYVWLVKNVAATRVSTYAFVNPIVAVILGWALADEVLDARTLLAAVIVVAGVALIVLWRPQAAPPRAAAPPVPEADGA